MAPQMTEMHRDRETDCREEVRGEAERGGAGRLDALVRVGKHPTRLLTKACILLKADAPEAGEGWSDSQIAAALDTSTDTVARTRQQLVEEGFEAVLVRKHSPASARPCIFDGAAEAKLIALACSEPPKGRKRWTLQLLEEAVVELNIVERAFPPARPANSSSGSSGTARPNWCGDCRARPPAAQRGPRCRLRTPIRLRSIDPSA